MLYNERISEDINIVIIKQYFWNMSVENQVALTEVYA